MSHRSTLRTAVLAAVAAGAVLVPSAAALADDATPTQTPGTEQSAPAVASPEPTSVTEQPAASSPEPTPATDGVPSRAPRGGVAAGERPVENGSDTTALYGPAVGAVLLAGAGTLVLRRRGAAHRNS